LREGNAQTSHEWGASLASKASDVEDYRMHCLTAVLVSAATLVGCAPTHSAPSKEAIAPTESEFARLFEDECIHQQHRDWAREVFSRRISDCGGPSTSCAMRLEQQVQWPVSLSDGGAVIVALSWEASSAPDVPRRPIDCGVSTGPEHRALLLAVPSRLSLDGISLSGPVEGAPEGDFDRVLVWNVRGNSQARPLVRLVHWPPAASVESASWRASYLLAHEQHPWELQYRALSSS
jgi:hypothetical protein